MSSQTKTGKVYLIGAGPGDPGLVTVRARELIETADVLVYDYLANPKLLDWARPEAERIYVGKRSGLHSIPQDEIEEILVERANKGQQVVRLKGGDPFVFGRGGEEIAELEDRRNSLRNSSWSHRSAGSSSLRRHPPLPPLVQLVDHVSHRP